MTDEPLTDEVLEPLTDEQLDTMKIIHAKASYILSLIAEVSEDRKRIEEVLPALRDMVLERTGSFARSITAIKKFVAHYDEKGAKP